MNIMKHLMNGTLLTDWGAAVVTVVLFSALGILLLSW